MNAPVDIFISYKREERALAQDVGRVLQEAGYTTITDLNIKKSKDFGDAIDQMIRQARLVVVLWTPMSAKSDWVKMEAREANALQKYFGVVLKPLERRDLPLELRRKQYLDLGGKMPRDLPLIVKDVASLIGEGSNTKEEANVASEELNDDFHLFQVVDRLGYAEGYQAYLDDYPNGIFANRARDKIADSDNVSNPDLQSLKAELAEARSVISRQKRALDSIDAEDLQSQLADANEAIAHQADEIAAAKQKKPALFSVLADARMAVLILCLAALPFGAFEIMARVSEGASPNEIAVLDEADSPNKPGQADPSPAETASNRLTYNDLPGSLQCVTFPWTFAQTLKGGFEGTIPSLGEVYASDKVPGVILDTEAGEFCLPTTLQALRLRGPDVKDISVIGYLPELRELYLDETSVTDILPVTTLGKLHRLDIYAAPLWHLDGLEGVTSLRDVRLDGTMVKSLDPLKDLPNLHHLSTSNGDTAGNPLIDTESTRATVRALIDQKAP